MQFFVQALGFLGDSSGLEMIGITYIHNSTNYITKFQLLTVDISNAELLHIISLMYGMTSHDSK